MTYIDCKTIAEKWKKEIKNFNIKAGLCVIQVGNDPASNIYVNGKKKDCEEFGFEFRHILIDDGDENIVREKIKETILQLANKELYFGCIVQLPLPKGITLNYKIEDYLPSYMDVDGLNSNSCFEPCTPEAIIEMLKEIEIDISGKHCVIAGYSNIVGKPLAHMMSERGATVTVCRSHTPQKILYKLASEADIFISAVGQEGLITSDIFKSGAVVIDIGINRTKNGLRGDIEIVQGTKDILITPVPGGVGFLTRAMLMKHVAVTGRIMYN